MLYLRLHSIWDYQCVPPCSTLNCICFKSHWDDYSRQLTSTKSYLCSSCTVLLWGGPAISILQKWDKVPHLTPSNLMTQGVHADKTTSVSQWMPTPGGNQSGKQSNDLKKITLFKEEKKVTLPNLHIESLPIQDRAGRKLVQISWGFREDKKKTLKQFHNSACWEEDNTRASRQVDPSVGFAMAHKFDR